MPAEDLPRRRIAVIGGGISGLAAAHRLTELQSGAEIVLFEGSSRLGGVIETVREGGFLIEKSADSFITNLPWAIDLCRRIEFADQLIPTDAANRGAMVVARGKLERVPDGFLLMAPERLRPVMRSPVLSVRGRLRLARERFIKPRRDDSDESVASFARRRLGRETFERLVQPLVGGIYTADPEKLSMTATMPRFLEMERQHGSLRRGLQAERSVRNSPESTSGGELPQADAGARYSMFVAPRGGLSSLIAAISARLPSGCVRLNSSVERIEQGNGKWRVLLKSDPATSEDFDDLIIASAAPTAARLCESVDATLAAELAAIEYAGSAIVVLGYDRAQIQHPLDSFGFVVPAIEGRPILSASFSSVKFPSRAPDGKVLMRIFFGGALQPEALELSDERLIEVAHEELGDLLGVFGEPNLKKVFRWPRAMPQYHVGHVERLKRIEDRLSQLPGLALAGNAFRGVGIPQCVRSGEEAAEKVLSALAG
jgi:protoporphyrinogen/coproporphyrinogen III oxidase